MPKHTPQWNIAVAVVEKTLSTVRACPQVFLDSPDQFFCARASSLSRSAFQLFAQSALDDFIDGETFIPHEPWEEDDASLTRTFFLNDKLLMVSHVTLDATPPGDWIIVVYPGN